jgi:membrane protein DedA with SNARE-associated domain
VHNVFDWIRDYGVAGLFVALMLEIIALPIPGEALMTFAGYLVQRGDLPLVATIVAGFAGSSTGITISYGMGRTIGFYLVRRFGPLARIGPEEIERVHRWFARRGKWGLAFGYFVPGVRHLTGLVAGSSKLEFPVFALFAYGGALFWVCLFISLGYFLGKQWEEASDKMQRGILIAVVAAGTVLLIVLVVRYRQMRRAKS